MSRVNEPSFLAKLADLFRAEGDTATADALVVQCESASSRSISDENRRLVARLQRKGLRLDNQGAHEDAEGWLAGALSMIEQALGPDHVDVIDHLNDLARCRFNGGKYEAALGNYQRLLRLVERAYGSDDQLAAINGYYIKECRQRLHTSIAAQGLQLQMTVMLRQARGIRSIENGKYQERLRRIAGRLLARGRASAGAHLLERWIALRLRDAEPNSEVALEDMRDYAIALWNGCNPARAVHAFSAIVLIRNQRAPQDGHESGLKQALADLGVCLAAMGRQHSAQETAALAESIVLPKPHD